MNIRLIGLDVAKGIAILLVVLGHIVARDNVPGAYWYTSMKQLIYLFHMPLFMVLSGMALGLSWKHLESMHSVAALVAQRVKRLLIPYILFGVLIVGGKIAAGRFIRVDNPPGDFISGIFMVLFYPMQSSSSFLWYIELLAIYFIIILWFMQISSRWTPWGFLLIGTALQGYEWSRFLNMAGFVAYLPFFSVGILLGQYWSQVQSRLFKPSAWPLWLIPFGSALAYSQIVTPLPKWLVGSLSVPFVLCVAQVASGRLQKWLIFLGGQTLSIYLMNTIFIGLGKAVLMLFLPLRDQYFVIYFIVLALSGIYLPIFTKKLLKKIKPSLAEYI